ncbi:cupin [Nocardia carnea]|uniref:cupin n=1 Tax=Nocardia carnea TaxID=37328 RepID=UPI002453E756|nr:cupin [Nocardia carnea]
MPPIPIDLFHRGVRVLRDGTMFDEPRRMIGDIDGWSLGAFHLETAADAHGDHWEVHPSGDELVAVLTGGIRMFFHPENPGAEEDSLALTAGQACIVPRDRLHRIELDGPTDLLSLSPRRGSRLEERAR